jgi:polysaccharide biosynthesis/export protein
MASNEPMRRGCETSWDERGVVMKFKTGWQASMCLVVTLVLAACNSGPSLKSATMASTAPGPDYVIGPLDNLNIFVWHNPDLTESVPVRPDGRISVPLIEDLPAAGKTPTQLARDIEKRLKKFVQDPVVTVIVTGFNGPYSSQVRVIGEAAHPAAIPYRENMTVLDVMIAVGGLTQFAAGNRAAIVREVDHKEVSYNVRLDDLIKDGDVSANVKMLPGDILIIPQSWF